MLKANTKKQQSLLAQYCRDGHTPQLEGVRPDRLHHYRRLVFNIIYDALEQAFPILRSKVSQTRWKSIIDDFVAHYKFSEKELWRLPLHFLDYSKESRLSEKTQMPWLDDLLELEWAEIEVYNAKDQELQVHAIKGVPLNQRALFINPYHCWLQLQYPVFKADFFQSDADHKGQYFLICYRDFQQMKAHYREISPFGVLVLQSLAQGHAKNLNTLGHFLQNEFNIPPHVIKHDLPSFVRDMISADILY